jgi:orotate phosphoribosyltransferase
LTQKPELRECARQALAEVRRKSMTGPQASAKRDKARDRTRLIEIIKERSFQSGTEMKLASGRTSTYYFNMKATMLHPEGAHLIANLILDNLEDIETDLIGGLEMGAVPIASATSAVSYARGRPVAAFFVRKQAKDHGTQSLVEGLAKNENVSGRKLVIVEDVTTTGGSAIKAAEAVRAAGGNVVRVITVVDRQEGAAEAFAAAGFDFTSLLTLTDFKS